MATIELTINTNYVPSWGTWEAVREILQNAKDADDLGHKMEVKYHPKTERLVIKSEGADLTRETLLLGATSKAGRSDQRGQFGEGYKLALLVLARQGAEVTIHTPRETWVPTLTDSTTFDGAEVLTIRTRPRKSRTQSVEFVVKGITEAAWRSVQANCLFLQTAMPHIKTHAGSVLTDPELANKLFVGGLFVSDLPDRYRYGYDLQNVHLDRDRKMAEPWSLRWEISKVLNEAVADDQLDLDKVLRMDSGEMKAMAENTEYIKQVAAKVVQEFEAENGEDAVAVDDMAQAQRAGQHGMKAVVVSREKRLVIEACKGKLDDRIQDRDTDTKVLVQPDDLGADECANLVWATELVEVFAGLTEAVQVVEFYGERIDGCTDGKTIRLARRILTNRAQLIATFVHEVAHRHGPDGSAEHRAAIEDIFAKIVVGQAA
jgi:hypothetical protein